MALEIRQSLKLGQQLVITPQLQQAIKLLQMSRLELQNLVQNELLENPILEETAEEPASKEEEVSVSEPAALLHEAHDKDQKQAEVGNKDGEMKEPTNFDWENYLGNYSSADMGQSGQGMPDSSDEMPPYESMFSGAESLQDHLLWQLHMSDFPPEYIEIGEEIIGNVGDDGYLKVPAEEIAATLNQDPKRVEEALHLVQEFDPTGVGSRSLAECLTIQVRAYPYEDRKLLEKMIEHHLENIEKKNFQVIAKDLGISIEKMRELNHILSTLEPKPGRPFGLEKPQYIIPDVHVEKIGEEYIILLNDDGLPKLQLSHFYRNTLLQKEVPSPAKEYIQDKLRSAMWLIKSIHQRQRTLYKVSSAIVRYQKGFFENGVGALKPMLLRDIADEVQMHESTISRVTTNKYMQTPRGLFELKFFFNSRVPSGSADGMTSEAVKQEIKKMVTTEDPHKPLSDQLITDLLQKSSIQIARRTVAKYREMMGILPASRRKQGF